MAYRDDLTALRDRQQSLVTEVASNAAELDATTRDAAAARARAKLPLFPDIRVAAPCSAEWAAMPGDDKVRACGACNKNVYNLSGMTRVEAEAVIVEHGGKLCLRYYQRADGTILLKDCEIGVAQRRRRRIVAVGATALLASAAGAYAGMSPHHAASVPAPQPQVGARLTVSDQPMPMMGGSASEAQPLPMMGAPPPHVAPTVGHVHIEVSPRKSRR